MLNTNTPSLRPQPKEIDRVIILIGGNPLDGKSYLSSQLINDNIDYISMDKVVVLNTEIPSIEKFKKKIKNPIECVDDINKHISKTSVTEFISLLFREYIDKCLKKTILLDGHIFTFNNIIEEIKKKCVDSSTRLWVLKKEKL
jgi:adenylate kinase family enzyme